MLNNLLTFIKKSDVDGLVSNVGTYYQNGDDVYLFQSKVLLAILKFFAALNFIKSEEVNGYCSNAYWPDELRYPETRFMIVNFTFCRVHNQDGNWDYSEYSDDDLAIDLPF